MAGRATVLAVAVVIAMLAGQSAASGEEPSDPPDQACAVVDQQTVECFATEAEMEAATSGLGGGSSFTSSGSVASEDGADTDAYCNGQSTLWVYLYEGYNMTGRVVKFRDAAVWLNLANWGFDNMTSSWKNNTHCTAFLAEYSNGGGSWLTLAAQSQSSQVSASWNDRASSLWINP